jgi:CheY-like chemotaxis protein
MSMPVMDGMTSTRAIRQYEQTYSVPRCCIVALTGLASNSARLEAWNSGIDQYMTKPVNFKKLSEILSQERARRERKESAKKEGKRDA